jgi:hypothetical protein
MFDVGLIEKYTEKYEAGDSGIFGGHLALLGMRHRFFMLVFQLLRSSVYAA